MDKKSCKKKIKAKKGQEDSMVKTDMELILADRGEKYGDFSELARISQNIKTAMEDSPNWLHLSPDKKAALTMVTLKLGRILNGDAEYIDNYVDICGYVTLIIRNLEKVETEGLLNKEKTNKLWFETSV